MFCAIRCDIVICYLKATGVNEDSFEDQRIAIPHVYRAGSSDDVPLESVIHSYALLSL